MISLEDYLKDPCGSSSLPWWKTRDFQLPPSIQVVHARDFDESLLLYHHDEPYFRLHHDLIHIPEKSLPGFDIRQATSADAREIARIINASYPDISVSLKTVNSWCELPVYDPALWLMVRKTDSGKAVACATAEYDHQAREGILDWVQVLPAYRRRGIGRTMVYALLSRLKDKADFATVSGRINNPANPEALYRACGFTGNGMWHVLRGR
jgi:ribosomal protein S18 acetylase RimI-like enzyme